MEEILLTCPHCGFSREIPQGKIPQGASRAACPECKRRFGLAEALTRPGKVVSSNSSDDWHYWGKLANHRVRQEDQQTTALRGQGIAAILGEGWLLFRARAGSLSILYLYMLVLGAAPWLFYWQFRVGTFSASARWRESLLVLLLVTVASLSGVVLGWGALLRGVVDEEGTIGGSIRGGFKNFFGNVQLGCWMLVLVVGGAFLLVLPAVFFASYASLAFFVYVHERERGLNAICISRQYVRGACRDTLGKLVVLMLLLLLGSLFVVTQIVILPYVLVCLGLVYRDLRQKLQDTRCLADGNFRWRIVWPVAAAYFVVILGFVVICSRENGFGESSVGVRLAGLKQQARSLLIDSWRVSGVSAPGCGLILSKRAFTPSERMEVRLALSSKIAQNYYVCIARDGEGCYESFVLDEAIQTQRLFVVSAPKQQGTYHLKVFSDYDRTVAVSSLEFKVI